MSVMHALAVAVLSQCEPAITIFKVDDISPLSTGTSANMDDGGLDLGGIWWMSPLPATIDTYTLEPDDENGIPGNDFPEYFISFAGQYENSSSFPKLMQVPNSGAGAWTWANSLMGWAIMTYYAILGVKDHAYSDCPYGAAGAAGSDCRTLQDFVWLNETMGYIRPVSPVFDADTFWIIKENHTHPDPDRWLRVTQRTGEPFEDANLIYTLVRVVSPYGHKTAYFDDWLDFAANGGVEGDLTLRPLRTTRTWATNNYCQRVCQSLIPGGFAVNAAVCCPLCAIFGETP